MISVAKKERHSKKHSVAENKIKGAEEEGSSEKSQEQSRKRLLLGRKIQSLPNMLRYI